MNITKEQFIDLVVALEQRSLTIWYVESRGIDESMDEVPEDIAAKIEDFEALQHQIYTLASAYDMQDQFEVQEDTGLLTLKTDSDVEKIVWESIDDMEQTILYEMLVRYFVIKKSQEMQKTDASWDFIAEDFFPVIEKYSKKLWNEFESNDLQNISLDISE